MSGGSTNQTRRLGLGVTGAGVAVGLGALMVAGCASAPGQPRAAVTVTVTASASSSSPASTPATHPPATHRAPPPSPASTPAATSAPAPSPAQAAPRSAAAQPAPQAAAWCSATASVYDAEYDENNVYVHSDQPYRDATASADGHSWSYETNGSGYALIYLNGPPPGAEITVTVGGATCTTSD
jgi:hypothetical protein